MQHQGALSHRVILHIDFDSYYTQVEMKRLGIPRETPCAVQQWEGLIAVNYPARARGITRHMRVKEAKKICPELVLVHVQTIGASGSSDSGAPAGIGAEGSGAEGSSGGGQESRRLTQKACLERYRRSTAEVLVLLHRLAPTAVIEKASIDEVYMDVTAMVDKELQGQRSGGAAPASVDAFAWGSVVIGGPLDPSREFERRLAAGAGIACRLRGALLSEMGYTASAGVATNKLLAKIGSAMHKPNQQTVIPPHSVQQVMQDLPLSKLRGFGGKLGEQLEALGCTTAGQVQQLPRATLVSRFGAERAAAIEQLVCGVSSEPVQERERPKSMLAAKSFNATSDLAALEGWLRILAQELASRMVADEAQFRRRPRNLVVHYRGSMHQGSERSKSCPMPRFGSGGASADTISQAAFALFKSKCASEALPCSRLAISAADFTDLPAAGGSAITRFLLARPAAQAAAGAAAAAAAEGEGAAAGPAAAGSAAAAAVATAAGVVAGDEPSGAETATTEVGQQPPAAQAPVQQQQQQQQHAKQLPQPAHHGRQRQAAAGASIGSLFERAQKRQRLGPEQAAQPTATADSSTTAGITATAAAAAGDGSTAADVQRGMLPSALPAAPGSEPAAQQLAPGPAPTADSAAPKHDSAAAVEAAPAASAGAAAVAAGGEPAGNDADLAEAAELAGVDVEEQRRILRDIRLMQHLTQRSSRPAGGASSRPGNGGGERGGGRKAARPAGKQQPQQPGISAFFSKQPKGG